MRTQDEIVARVRKSDSFLGFDRELLGLDALVAEIESATYPNYGAPQLAVACRGLGLPIPDDVETQRMIDGEPCVSDCDQGCGR